MQNEVEATKPSEYARATTAWEAPHIDKAPFLSTIGAVTCALLKKPQRVEISMCPPPVLIVQRLLHGTTSLQHTVMSSHSRSHSQSSFSLEFLSVNLA